MEIIVNGLIVDKPINHKLNVISGNAAPCE